MPRKRLVRAFLAGFAALAVLLWIAFALIGLRIVRVSRPIDSLRQAAPPEPQDLSEVRESSETEPEGPKNLVLVIADGFGFAHLSASRTALQGINAPAVWDRFSTAGWQRTHPVAGFLTDSAAAATALATGRPTNYGAIGVDADGQLLETLFDLAVSQGYRTGIVTDSYVWDATPAAFVTHSAARLDENAGETLRQLGESSLEVLVGELEDVGEGPVPEWQESVELLAGRFEVLGPRADDALFGRLATGSSPIAAIFEEDQVNDLQSTPDLPSLTTAALERLSSDERSFLLLVESEEVDSASHDNDLDRMLKGLEALEATLEAILDFAAENGQTLVVFTSDHETGGLALGISGIRNSTLQAIWATRDHTGTVVPVLGYGPGAGAFGRVHTNWQLGSELARTLRRP